MNKDAKPSDLACSLLTRGQPNAASPSSSSSCSPNPEDRRKRIVINDGVLAGLHGLRLQSHGNARCLVQLEGIGSHFLMEIDENFVEWAG